MIRVLKNIKIDIPFKKIYIRLGFNFHSTNITQKDKEKVENSIKLAASYCELSGLWKVEDIIKKEENKIFINDYIFESGKLTKFLEKSNRVVILATTTSEKVVLYRDRLMKEGDMFTATIVDATASEMVESYTDYIHSLIEKEFTKKGESITKNRFSPGYGDFHLKYQKVIDKILDLSQINIHILDNFILYPEKSITAFIGIN